MQVVEECFEDRFGDGDPGYGVRAPRTDPEVLHAATAREFGLEVVTDEHGEDFDARCN
jgi:predicted nucleic acid-binding protein